MIYVPINITRLEQGPYEDCTSNGQYIYVYIIYIIMDKYLGT